MKDVVDIDSVITLQERTLSFADDCEKLVNVLSSAPKGGMTMFEIHEATGWSLVLVNDVLCGLGKSIQFAKTRERNKKVTRYSLRENLQ